MRYLLKITAILVLLSTIVVTAVHAQSDDIPPAGERLGSRSQELMEMASIAYAYKSTDLLSYNVSYDFADSAAIGTILEHKDGKYKLYDNLFWGMIDSASEYLQGHQNYVVVDHGNKNIYVYKKLDYSRVINVPMLDSMFNEIALKDLILSRPGGIYKKLSIQYMPGMQYKQPTLQLNRRRSL